jgi:uncharacterized membrane protein YkoI
MSAIRFTTALMTAVLAIWPASAAVADRGSDTEIQTPAVSPSDERTGPSMIALGSGADLIRLAEKKLRGARVYDLDLSDEGAVPWFEVKAYRAGQVWSIMIDAATRRIVRPARARPASEFDPDTQRDLADFGRIRMKLSEAVMIAEKLGGGRAISAGLHRDEDRLVFVVVVVADGTLKEITVQPDK